MIVDADAWYTYTGGIIRQHCASSPDTGDHAVQVTGFGTDTSTGMDARSAGCSDCHDRPAHAVLVGAQLVGG